MSFKSSPIFLTGVTIVIIVLAIAITASVQSALVAHPQVSFSKVITVGPVWDGKTWTCTSDKDFVVSGTVRGLQDSQLTISITGLGTQSLYALDPGKMQSFTVGSPGGHSMVITRTNVVSGWFTLQTASDAQASCTQSQ